MHSNKFRACTIYFHHGCLKMYIDCLNCGKTNIPGGTANCPACGRALPKVIAPSSTTFSRPVVVDSRGRQYMLNSSAATVIGSRGCAIMLSDPGVPPQAARLMPSSGGFLLEDLSGTVRVNGVKLTVPKPLQPGDKVSIGSANLTYQGPSTTAIIPSTPKTIPTVISSPPTVSPPPMITSSSPPVALKGWGANRPLVEGTIEFMDGPHRVEKGSMGGKVAAALLIGIFYAPLMGLPFWTKQDIMVWYLRIKAYPTGKIHAVIMRGEPGGLPQMSDFIAIWGEEKDGNILMKRGYNYTTDSLIPLKG